MLTLKKEETMQRYGSEKLHMQDVCTPRDVGEGRKRNPKPQLTVCRVPAGLAWCYTFVAADPFPI
jgi:hypothetical protein